MVAVHVVTTVSGFIKQVGSMINRNSKTQLSSINLPHNPSSFKELVETLVC